MNMDYRIFINFSFYLLITLNGFSQDILQSPKVIQDPENYYKYASDSRRFTGIPSLAIAPQGRLWTTWYAGRTPGEDQNNYVVVSTSGDNGHTWSEVMVVDPDGAGPVRAYDPQLWLDPDHRLWFFWTQTIGLNGTVAGVWYMTTDNPDDENPEWTAPKRITDGVMMNKPTVLANGDWVLAVSTWRDTDNSAKVFASSDKGHHWELRGAVHVPKEDREYDEHMIVEKKDGTLWMLVRTKYGIGESFSHDAGKTWEKLSPSRFKHTSSRFHMRRLASGNLLFVKNGPLNIKTGRSHLMAFISTDDGNSWSNGTLIDERVNVSYPDGQQRADGTIFIVYDFDRYGTQQILVTSFEEETLTQLPPDEAILAVFKNRHNVSKGGR